MIHVQLLHRPPLTTCLQWLMLMGEAGIDIAINDPQVPDISMAKNICGSYVDSVLGWVVKVNRQPLVMKLEKLTKTMCTSTQLYSTCTKMFTYTSYIIMSKQKITTKLVKWRDFYPHLDKTINNQNSSKRLGIAHVHLLAWRMKVQSLLRVSKCLITMCKTSPLFNHI